MKAYNKFTDELINSVKEYFLNNDISLVKLSKNSQELFGQEFSEFDIKGWSRSDSNGPWSVQKVNGGRSTDEVPIAEQIRIMANKLYNIMNDSEEALPVIQLVQVARTWADLIDKAKLTKEGATAKSSAQQVKDIFEREDAASKTR